MYNIMKTKTFWWYLVSFGIALGISACVLNKPFQPPVPVTQPPVAPSADTITNGPTPQPPHNIPPDAEQTVAPTAVSSTQPHQVKEVQHAAESPSFEINAMQYPLRTYRTLATNDPNGTQWWTTTTGLNTAWDIGAGTHQTTVAIIDTGFALQHEEFANRWASSNGEQGPAANENPSALNCTDRAMPLDRSCNLIDDNYDGLVDNELGITTLENPSRYNCTDQSKSIDKACNRIDDDSNGYIDDVIGWDFANNDANVQAGEVDPDGSGTQHGTETAGILAATGNNNKGIAGVNWSTRVLPLQAIDDLGYGNTLTVARAIYYAADKGVDVISISLGADEEDPYLRQAIQYALNKGSAVVAASGNDGCDCISYPANYPEVFAVGAQNAANQPSSFSNYGTALDILAPGEDMRAPTWQKANATSAYASGISGTSFATPYVSGLLALARSHTPDASWGELQNALLSTANHAGLSIAAPVAPRLGSGYARANSYLARITTPGQPGMRYRFDPLVRLTTLGSDYAYDCRPENGFPTALLYKITENASSYYSIDTLASIDAVVNGGSSTVVTRVCVGLPGDIPGTVRMINLFREIENASTKH